MTFDLQSIWAAAGMSAAALLIGYIFGFLQSVAPFIPSSGTVRNWVIVVIAAGLVALAGVTSGAEASVPNLFGGFLVFLGIYTAASKTSEAGTATAVRTAGGAEVKP